MDTKAKILDIAMNLNRIGNWAADNYISFPPLPKNIYKFSQRVSETLASISKI